MAQEASKQLRILVSYGDDFLRRRFNKQNLQSLVSKCPSGTQIITLYDPSPQEILRNALGSSLFGQFQIVFAVFSDKLPDLAPLCDRLSESSSSHYPILITTPDVRSGKSFVSKVEKTHGSGILRASGFNRCKDSREAKSFLRDECESSGLQITSSALSLLSELCLPDFGMLAGDVSTLLTISDGEKIDDNIVMEHIVPTSPTLNFLDVYMGVLKGDFSLVQNSLFDVGPGEFEPLTAVVLKILTAALGGSPKSVDFSIPNMRPLWKSDAPSNQKDKALTPFMIKVGQAVSKRLSKQEIRNIFTDMYDAAQAYRRNTDKSGAVLTLASTLRRLCGL